MLLFILNAILIAVALYCTWSVAYQFIFALAARFKKTPNPSNNATSAQTTFAVIIPAYKEDNVILETAQKALTQQYPKDKFDVFVIAGRKNVEKCWYCAAIHRPLWRVKLSVFRTFSS